MPLSKSNSRSASRHRRQASASTKSSISDEKEALFGSADYRSTVLEPNHIIIEDHQMDDERWSRLAFALGMPFGEVHRPNATASKLAQQISSRRTITSGEMTELLIPLLVSIAKDHKLMKCRTNTPFYRDGVPDEIPDFDIEDGWKMQLPTPKPAITLGYSKGSFNPHQLDLQQGIIANNKNDPCDLHKLSQPVPDVYWPFFIVEVQEESMLAARNACAGSAATCNNALMIFAGAAQEPQKHYHDVNFLWDLSKAVQSFSLAINGKTACLSTHNSEGCLPHAVAVIKTYRLDDEKELEALASRISSILVWAENCRLRSICDLLNGFDNRVRLVRNTPLKSEDWYAPTELANFGEVPKTRMTIIKEVFVESLPRWARVSYD
ncbi:hypothetical protein LTR10_019109 [Elasticomyces elasticus]|uniref:DUF7924 domain-containing protein n=1 Tax=Exophiala sideris TaxID=1016849 RepID=A0ABR0JH78_9EURO|nr:hypothetical protein LTR10_019109 [Elasticomyces elasticus]KAK5033483.1 hypothetical protein LTS07_003787 [Exophiala sideris]KAK5042022.1 hypothetical protein LTR13_001828 [Exophiala sideris]KAK5064027.1 hypothetical protein LTR69_003795 [Exophiala sideris]KAK5185290.1 hypothetical protein LTR44_002279 [Eurotiomycetes sp. CCFEE 6388]